VKHREPTRRWLLQLGAGAALSGFSGMPGDGAESLPAGLYLPSTEHVAHALKAAALADPLAGYKPQFFSPDELTTVRRITGLLLGDVPDASHLIADIVNWIDLTVYDSAAVRAAANGLAAPHRALAVAYYGSDAVRELETLDPQAICRDGLRALALHSNSGTGEGLRAILNRYVGATENPNQDALGRFLSFLKVRALEGYYTSRPGLRELDYKGNSFYGESPGCVVQSGQHA
jgi:hypothetical protein